MKHGSLFSGIGGFELAAQWMGWENIFHSEINPFGSKILDYYWPNSENIGDVKNADFTKYAGQIDIITGGFPCQPYSTAGKRFGKEDERHLWPYMLKAIREIKPRWVIGENVRGLISWNEGMVFDEVHTDLETEGYEVQAFVLPASGVNAPHRRERVWFVAHTNFSRSEKSKLQYSDILARPSWDNWETEIEPNENKLSASDTESTRFPSRIERQREEQSRRGDVRNSIPGYWKDFPSESPVCSGDDGLPSRLDGITIPRWRKESIMAYGNAIVPQVAFQLFKVIQKIDKITEAQN